MVGNYNVSVTLPLSDKVQGCHECGTIIGRRVLIGVEMEVDVKQDLCLHECK